MTDYYIHVVKPNGFTFVYDKKYAVRQKAIDYADLLATHSSDEFTVMQGNNRQCTFFGQKPARVQLSLVN